eukprot:TRINITY_DN2760_c0_g1_i1.p1 TRINITY_DN2760_c0_g1~~TRINITY_DN2760_c0_g1_i1.p1  ORF type:complete len:127 (+),score=25.76 TRINITY_DN2760_c0_g1_i1:136-516(+)
MSAADTTDPYIYKLVSTQEWVDFQKSGEFTGSAVDKQDGFIHLSDRKELRKTGQLYFSKEVVPDVVLFLVSVEQVQKDLRWEEAKSRAAFFPHVFRHLSLSDVGPHYPLSRDEKGDFIYPPELNIL